MEERRKEMIKMLNLFLVVFVVLPLLAVIARVCYYGLEEDYDVVYVVEYPSDYRDVF